MLDVYLGAARARAGARVKWEPRLRVLAAVVASPGASSVEVASAVGVCEVLELARLLAEVQDAGLIRSVAPERGGSRAWTVTPRGLEVARVMSRAAAAHTHWGSSAEFAGA